MIDHQPVKPCPWCGEVPAIKEGAFVYTDGCEWGALACCGTGPEVRTNYLPVDDWKDAAIAAWNDRAADKENKK